MNVRRQPALIAGLMLALLPGAASAQATTTGGTLLVHPSDETSLEDAAPSPTSEQAVAPGTPLQPMTNPGSVFKNGYYRGVVPGQSHIPPRARRLAKTRRNYVVWPGFEMLDGGGSRVFIQSTRPVTYTREDAPGRIVIVLRNTRIHLRNNRNPLVTEHFNTPVAEAYLTRRGRDTLLVLEMKTEVTPTVRQVSENGYHFLFIEFPAGRYPIPDRIRRGYRLSEAAARARRH